MTDRNKKLTKAIPTRNADATEVARIFSEHRVTDFGISSKLGT